jgi:hypothetical protein
LWWRLLLPSTVCRTWRTRALAWPSKKDPCASWTHLPPPNCQWAGPRRRPPLAMDRACTTPRCGTRPVSTACRTNAVYSGPMLSLLGARNGRWRVLRASNKLRPRKPTTHLCTEREGLCQGSPEWAGVPNDFQRHTPPRLLGHRRPEVVHGAENGAMAVTPAESSPATGATARRHLGNGGAPSSGR